MSNHLTPTELAYETGLDRQAVIATCVELGVPIFAGKIDKTLFAASVQASGHEPGAGSSGAQTAT